MRHVPPLLLDDAELFDGIAAAKRQPRRGYLLAVRGAVLAAYQTYTDAVPDVGDLATIAMTGDQAGALVHAYEVETAPLNRLRGRLLGRMLTARCPFCGIGESSTLDHYLPKENYPEFAIMSRNLVPSCSPCNTRKSRLVVDEDTNVRLFLHPYYDVIPLVPFVRAEVTLLNDLLVLSYSVAQPAGMDRRTYRHLHSHFSRLRLADRYRLMSLEHLRDRYRAFARFYGPTEDAERVAEELNQDAEDLAEEYGPNHWRAVLYRALAADSGFCDGGFEVLRQIQ
jgi:hypothetical protein